MLRFHVDRAARTVDASVAGLLTSHAVFHDGLGCVLLHGSEPYHPKERYRCAEGAEIAAAAGGDRRPGCRAAVRPRTEAALDHAFEEPAEPPFRRTKAVVVVRDGKVIAERYADGIGVDTPLLGFSMTKSVVTALIGIMTQQGLISPSLPAPVPEWRGQNDPRREIEVREFAAHDHRFGAG